MAVPHMIATGGKSIYSASVGILMLDAKIPRILGDTGNALTWPFPVHYKIVREATPERVVLCQAAGTLDAFIDAAREMVDDGVEGITTTCGFLSLIQDELQAAVPVPVAASSLMQVALVAATLPAGKHPSVLTISAASLTEAHLAGAGAPLDTPVGGVDPNGEFATKILRNHETLDVTRSREELIAGAKAVVERYPNTGALILECTNMVPYAAAVRAAIGIPVYSIYSFVIWFQAGLAPRQFTA